MKKNTQEWSEPETSRLFSTPCPKIKWVTSHSALAGCKAVTGVYRAAQDGVAELDTSRKISHLSCTAAFARTKVPHPRAHDRAPWSWREAQPPPCTITASNLHMSWLLLCQSKAGKQLSKQKYSKEQIQVISSLGSAVFPCFFHIRGVDEVSALSSKKILFKNFLPTF